MIKGDINQAKVNKCLIALVNRKVVQKVSSTVSCLLIPHGPNACLAWGLDGCPICMAGCAYIAPRGSCLFCTPSLYTDETYGTRLVGAECRMVGGLWWRFTSCVMERGFCAAWLTNILLELRIGVCRRCLEMSEGLTSGVSMKERDQFRCSKQKLEHWWCTWVMAVYM